MQPAVSPARTLLPDDRYWASSQTSTFWGHWKGFVRDVACGARKGDRTTILALPTQCLPQSARIPVHCAHGCYLCPQVS